MAIGTGVCCVSCQTYFAPKKNGVYVLETFEDGKTPYKIWIADLLQCPDCKREVVHGFGGVVSERFYPDFQEKLKLVTITISGCPRRLPSAYEDKVRKRLGMSEKEL